MESDGILWNIRGYLPIAWNLMEYLWNNVIIECH